MELIEKQAAIESLNRIPRIKGIGMELLIAVPDVEEMIAGLPSVPSVPLDKLCELLSHCTFPCDLLYLRCPYDDCNKNTNDREEAMQCWKDVLTKWMEGLG